MSMIQRIQTVYYLLAVLVMALPLAGLELFSFSNKKVLQSVNLFGSDSHLVLSKGKLFVLPQLPLFWANLVVIFLLLLTILMFRKLRLQARLGRFTLAVYGLTIIGISVVAYFFTQLLIAFQASLTFGIGFYLMLSGVLFILMGNRGVRKDRKLLDSLNRLR